MTDQHISLNVVWKSKLAKRLIPTFVAVVAIPLAVTVLVVGKVGEQQIVATGQSLQKSNLDIMKYAGTDFESIGQSALSRSSSKISEICLKAGKATSERSQRDQTSALAVSGRDFADVTQTSFDGAMHQSLAANKDALNGVGSQMGGLFANSAHYTQARVENRVQTAILQQINRQMRDRASQLAQSFDSYIQTNINYLGLTAEMLNLQDGSSSGQKSVLDALVRHFPMMSVVTLLDGTGAVTEISASDRIESPADQVNQSFSDYFKVSMRDQTYVGVDSFPVDGSAPLLRLAVPVELYRGKAVGVLTATLSLSDLWDSIRNERFGKGGFAYVADGNGYPFLPPRHVDGTVLEQSSPVNSIGWLLVVAQPRSEVMAPIQSFKNDISQKTQMSLSQMHSDIASASAMATAKMLSNADNLHAAITQRLKQRTREILGQLNRTTAQQSVDERAQMQQAIRSQIEQEQIANNLAMVRAANVESSDLALRIPQITSKALSLANKRLGLCALIILLLSCGLSCFIGFMLAGALVKPILQLSHGTRSLAMGDLDKRVDEKAPAEIGDLAIAFNMMAESLQKSRADLTDAEAQLVQSAKLASLGTLSAGVAHELNQPVAIVRGLAQQLKLETAIPEDVKEDLEIIERQTGRMMKIITHLRTFCRTGGYEMTPIDVNQVIRDCFILIDAQLKAHGVNVDLDLVDGSPMVLGDSNELEQVFINLITNARDAMDGVPDSRLRIHSAVESGQLLIEFRDNGLGIPDKIAEHIFDPFFTTKEVGKGTGLGLSISHGLIHKHKGSIIAKNDGGAVFLITIPLVDSVINSEDSGSASSLSVQRAA